MLKKGQRDKWHTREREVKRYLKENIKQSQTSDEGDMKQMEISEQRGDD